MIALLLVTLLSARPGVVIGVGQSGSELQVSRTSAANLGELGADTMVLTDVITPRSTQRGAGKAMQFTLDATLGEAITFEPRKPDATLKGLAEEEEGPALYGRVRVGKAWLHELLLKAGWAWVLPEARKDAALVKLEDEAREAKLGLWAEEAPLEPWLWRELTMLSDAETKVFHSGWECPHVKATQCRKCGSGRVYGFEEAAAAGFLPHEVCMTPELLRIAKASGGPGAVEREREGPPIFPESPRRACVKNEDCALTPSTPCTCPGCGTYWREAARKDVVARMKANFATAACAGVGCGACAGRAAGTRAVCQEKQCRPE